MNNELTRKLVGTFAETRHELLMEKTINYIFELEEKVKSQDKQIDQLTNNWNELEEWLKDLFEKGYDIKLVLDKMKKIKEKNK